MRNQVLSIFVMLIGVLMYSSCTSELSSNENVKDDVSLETRSMVGCDGGNDFPQPVFLWDMQQGPNNTCCFKLRFISKYEKMDFRIRIPGDESTYPLTVIEFDKGFINEAGIGVSHTSGSQTFCLPAGTEFAIEITDPNSSNPQFAVACFSFTLEC